MADYAILLDGERVASMDSGDDVRSWLVKYREEHVEDDPARSARPDTRARRVCLAHRRQARRPQDGSSNPLPTWDEVRARRLERSFLTTRAGPDRLLEVVHDLGGVHAQVQASAELQLAARLEGITQQDVREALWERRELVKAWTLRGTLHLHPSARAAAVVRGRPRRLAGRSGGAGSLGRSERRTAPRARKR